MNKVLLVDDSAYMRRTLRNLLSSDPDLSFVEAADGEAAVAAYTDERPAIVLLDILMPRKSGLEALREIRAIDPDATIIMVSAIGQEVIMQEALEAGAVGFIVKPFQQKQVIDAVEASLARGTAA